MHLLVGVRALVAAVCPDVVAEMMTQTGRGTQSSVEEDSVSDYGHDVIFGTFPTPVADQPMQPLALARLTEEVGLDLATFQDHPYQPAFLDTWTLMSYVAAQTTTIRLATNVTNLPLRLPTIIARSVASLDRLSGGRIELGLGAGAFWDAIEAMGGRRLSGAQSVRAVAEAIDVIRQSWDSGQRGGVRVAGEFYQVTGAKRGPAPAHDVSIWLGAYKPRMLALTGRLADGWLPSLAYLQPGDLGKGNAIIDQAALEAGRSPLSIRRLLNVNGRFAASTTGLLSGPPSQWVDELSELALSDGVSVFILGGDDPDLIRRFAAEVAPAVREVVETERAAQHRPGSDEGIPVVDEVANAPGRTSAPAGAATGPAETSRSGLSVTPTPDDGVRLSAERVWDESTRPRGPQREQDHGYTAHDEATAQHLVDVHDHLRGELAQIRDLIEQVAAGGIDAGAARSHINTMTIRQNKWTLGTYCESYCRVVTTHHTLEDQALFPSLRQADARLAPVIDRLQLEHMEIHAVLERVDRALVAFVAVPDGIPALRAAVDLLSDTLLSHLSYEERELVEPLARLGFS
jgi:alkanesulfonate monooxygenase SsuD/methylene tetrahydromethanopterin reductase-like flavin-dependent oxidoreductase (luciferase family)